MLTSEGAGGFRTNREISAGCQVKPTKMTVAVIAKIADVVVPRVASAQHRRPGRKAVGVIEFRRRITFAVAVVDRNALGSKPPHREVLTVEVGKEHVVVTDAMFDDLVEATVDTLLCAPEPADVILPKIVVPGAVKPYPERIVQKQETAEIRGEGLDAHP